MRSRLVPIVLVITILVGGWLLFQLGRQSEQISDENERIERLTDEMTGRTPEPRSG